MKYSVRLFLICSISFLLTFVCSGQTKVSTEANQQVPHKKFIYTEEEYRAYVNDILTNELKSFKNLYSNEIEVTFLVDDIQLKITFDLREPLFTPSERMVKAYEEFKRVNNNTQVSYNLYLTILRDYFYAGPVELRYVGTLSIDAKNVDELRMGNCFSITNYFISVTRLAGLSSYYYLVPDLESSYKVGKYVLNTRHIVCGVDFGYPRPFIIDYYPDANEYYKKLFAFRRVKKLTDLEAAGLFYNNIASMFIIKRDLGLAEYLLKFAEQLYPDSELIKNNLGVLYMQLDDPENALVYLFQGLKVSDKRLKKNLLANILKIYERSESERKKAIVKRIQKELNSNYYWHLIIAEKYMREKKYKQALKELKKAEKLYPENQEVIQYFLRYATLTNNSSLYHKYLKKVKIFYYPDSESDNTAKQKSKN